MKSLLRPVVLLLLAAPTPALAWNMVGHRTIGQIADNHLLPRTRREIIKLLGPESLALASTWADDYRETPTGKPSSTWHFVNAPDGLTRPEYTAYLRKRASGEPTLYTELSRLLAELRNPATPATRRKFALRFIIHLAGDAHQPLHAGRAEDQGGNTIKMVLRKDTISLHKYWDRDMVEYGGLSYLQLAARCDHATGRQITEWGRAPVEEWLFESYQLRSPIYQSAQNQAFLLLYYDQEALMRQRLLQAGVRLAAVLNSAFAQAPGSRLSHK